MNADIHYTRSGDTSIAYKVGGKGPPGHGLRTPGTSRISKMSWELPQASRVWQRLSSFGRIMTFDKRGTGLSDPITDDRLPWLEQRMDDMRAVMDAVGSWRGVLIGGSEGAMMCMLFAATYPASPISNKGPR
jgi:pimeloyl-ACP methyl ester carboxylesterase